MTALLDVRDLHTHFSTDDGIVKAVDGVDFRVEPGQTVGIVGESGCGKSVTCLSIMGLNEARNTIRNVKAVDVVSTGLRGDNLSEWRAHVRISFLIDRVSE